MKKLVFLAVLLAFAPIGLASDADSDAPVTRTLVWPDGTRYVGGVVDGKRSGKGTIFWQDGTRFVGQFENDMRNGPGTMILPDGTVYTGFFENDQLVDTEATIAAAEELDEEETATALGDTELPMEADSLSEPPTEEPQVDEYDLVAVQDEPDPIVEEPAYEDEPVFVADASTDIDSAPNSMDDSDAYSDESYSDDFDDVYSSDVTSVTETAKDELSETIDLWAAAWSDKNVPQYLSNYSDEFAVPGNQSRRTWEALRRTRLTRPRYINLDIVYERFEFVENNVIDVFFRQAYRSNTYSDLTDKVLRMQKEGTDWKILVERSR